jgi:hypothetical protein
MSTCNFTHQHYCDTLKRYLDSGFAVTSFDGYLKSPQKKHVILRHDIDLELGAAQRMAELDASSGVTSSFFFRIHASRYNLSSLESLKFLKLLKSRGFELGLHLEPGLGRALGENSEDFAERQKQIIEAIYGQPIIGLSTHEPARADEPELVERVVRKWNLKYHAYQPRFTKEFKYISDSSARWREGCFCEWVGKADQMQILTHPFWWYAEVSQENS